MFVFVNTRKQPEAKTIVTHNNRLVRERKYEIEGGMSKVLMLSNCQIVSQIVVFIFVVSVGSEIIFGLILSISLLLN